MTATREPAIHTLTSLRFFAAASIVYFHLQSGDLLARPFSPFAWGVSFFFVLSGFILFYNYKDTLARDNIGLFFVSRFARLWPIHVLTFMMAIAILPSLWVSLQSVFGLFSGALNLSLLHAIAPIRGITLSFNGVSWSISNELVFYAMFPLVLFAGRIRTALLISALAVSVQITTAEKFGAIVALPVGDWSWHHFILQNPFVRCFEFIFGMATAKLFMRIRAPIPAIFATIAEIAVLVFIVIFALNIGSIKRAFIHSDLLFTSIWVGQSGGVLLFAALIFVYAHQSGYISQVIKQPVFVLLGEISFAIYMVHQIFIKALREHGVIKLLGPYLSVMLICTLTLMASYLAWRFIEKPFRAKIIKTYMSVK